MQIAGHFIDKQSKQCFGVMGLQLTALRECTRDTEWKLLKITIVDFASKAEVQFAAERTAADAARMQAPLQFHGDEPELAEALQGLAPNNVELHFDCHTIMVSSIILHNLTGTIQCCCCLCCGKLLVRSMHCISKSTLTS